MGGVLPGPLASCSSARCMQGPPAMEGRRKYSRRVGTQGAVTELTRDPSAQISRTNIAHLFLLSAETSKGMNQ